MLICRTVTLALLRASGELGLEAFLPPPTRVVSYGLGRYSSPEDVDPTPHLPLNDRWEDGEFTLSDVLSGAPQDTNVREWTLRLLERYRFVIGTHSSLFLITSLMPRRGAADTPSHFAMLSGPSAFTGMLAHLKKHPDVALLCVNDDVAIDDDKVAALFKHWANEHWGTPAEWER